LWEHLKNEFEEAVFIPEPASIAIANLGMDITNKPRDFCLECTNISIAQEERALKLGRLIIQDRSIIDTLAYAKRDRCEDIIGYLNERIIEADYSGVLFCDFVGPYIKNEHRLEDEELAKETHRLLQGVYSSLNLPMIIVPGDNLVDRTKFAAESIRRILS
jgi:predicted ATPase